MLKNRYPHCKQGMPLVAPLLSFSIDSSPRRKTALFSTVILITENSSHTQNITSGDVARNSNETYVVNSGIFLIHGYDSHYMHNIDSSVTDYFLIAQSVSTI